MNLIDRDALILAICDIPVKFQTEDGEYVAINNAITVVENAPTIDAAHVVHGEWVNVVGGFFEMGRCSVCGGQWPTAGGLNFCPNCGAKMRHEDGEVGID